MLNEDSDRGGKYATLELYGLKLGQNTSRVPLSWKQQNTSVLEDLNYTDDFEYTVLRGDNTGIWFTILNKGVAARAFVKIKKVHTISWCTYITPTLHSNRIYFLCVQLICLQWNHRLQLICLCCLTAQPLAPRTGNRWKLVRRDIIYGCCIQKTMKYNNQRARNGFWA